MPLLESQIEKAIVSYAKKRGALSYKFASPSNRGVPDRIFFFEGATLLMEIKRTGQKPTPLQKHTMKTLTDAGVAVVWCDSVELGKKQIDGLVFGFGPSKDTCTCCDAL